MVTLSDVIKFWVNPDRPTPDNAFQLLLNRIENEEFADDVPPVIAEGVRNWAAAAPGNAALRCSEAIIGALAAERKV